MRIIDERQEKVRRAVALEGVRVAAILGKVSGLQEGYVNKVKN